jgi:hypothetical protein
MSLALNLRRAGQAVRALGKARSAASRVIAVARLVGAAKSIGVYPTFYMRHFIAFKYRNGLLFQCKSFVRFCLFHFTRFLCDKIEILTYSHYMKALGLIITTFVLITSYNTIFKNGNYFAGMGSMLGIK